MRPRCAALGPWPNPCKLRETDASEEAMLKFQKILVPVDFSKPSQGAVYLAGEIASQYKASITLLPVYQPPPASFPEGALAMSASANQELIHYLEQSLEDPRREAAAQLEVSVSSKLEVG